MARRHARYCSPRCRAAGHRNTLPIELRSLPRWVAHESKRPLMPDGSPASVTDPSTWSPFAAVRGLSSRGFVLNGDGVSAVDLDHCLRGDMLESWAVPLVELAGATYVEVSPSGDGLHVWGRAQLRGGRRVRVSGGGSAEVYGSGRFITVTARPWRRSRPVLGDISPLVTAILS